MLFKFLRIAAVLGLSVIGSSANDVRPRYANTSIPATTSSQSGTKSSQTPSTITSTASLIKYLDGNGSCNANVTIDLFDLLVPSLQALPSTEIWLSYWAEQTSIRKLEATMNAVFQQTITNTPAFWSEYTSLYYGLQSAVSSVWECYIDGYGQFQTMALSNPCLFKTCRNQFLSQSSSFVSAFPDNPIFWYTAEPPCCGQCSVYGDGVEVEYWPTPAPSPPVTALVGTGPNGVISTYLSPYAYATFYGLYAADMCSNVGGTTNDWYVWGPYAPGQLSTSEVPFQFVSGIIPPVGNWTAINYADYGPQCTCTPPNCAYDTFINQYITNLCTPQISIPEAVTSLFPMWSSCAADYFGVFDPPQALTVQPGLTLPKTTPASSAPANTPTGTTATAQPVNTPTAPGPTATAQPVTVAPTTSHTSVGVSAIVYTPPQPQSETLANSPVSQSSPNPASVPAQSSLIVPGGGNPTTAVPAQSSSVIVPGGGNPTTAAPAGGVTTTAVPSIVVNGQTITANSQGAFVVGTATITTNSQGNVVIAGQTVIAGGQAITVSGSTISLAPGATEVVFGGTSTTKLGSIIMSFLGVGGSSTTTTTGTGTAAAPAQYTGVGGKGADAPSLTLALVVILSMTMVWI